MTYENGKALLETDFISLRIPIPKHIHKEVERIAKGANGSGAGIIHRFC